MTAQGREVTAQFKRGDRVEVTLRGRAITDTCVEFRPAPELANDDCGPVWLAPTDLDPEDVTVTVIEPKRKTWRDMPEGELFRLADYDPSNRYWRKGSSVHVIGWDVPLNPAGSWDEFEAIPLRTVDAEDGES